MRRPPTRPRRQRASSDGSDGTGGRSRRRGRGRNSDFDDDRGQLFLVGALSLAVLFVGFALLLNTAIYTENLATRNTDPGTDPSISYRAAAEDAARELMIRENRNGTDPTWDENTQWYESSVEAWSDSAGLHAARRARVASVAVDSTNGTRFQQTNASRNLTNRNYAADWTLGNNPSAVRDASLTINADSLPETNRSNVLGLTLGFDDPYAVAFDDTDGGNTWHVYVYDDSDTGGDDVTVLVDDGTTEQECTHVGPAAHVDLSNGSINGSACSAFALLDLPDDAVDDEDIRLRFENGDQATGTYDIKVAEGADISGNVYDNEADDDGAAFATAIIYDADVTITYESTDVSYRTTVRIAPEEIR
ncbi:hypothetical protein C2R22_07435 [Salinigranum rubrum]|uniref:Uncharacterized protein n=1 Tax=Salinigranum rubrum TaxID=755307 RepID=A0A2I8VHU8_9EURY|nr:hypothetical protein C2R22_07435 [Salinigranum rubrum]